MQLWTVCDKRLEDPITSGNFESKISKNIQQTLYTWAKYVNSFSRTDD